MKTKENVMDGWTYKGSVDKVRKNFGAWRKKSTELVDELVQAKTHIMMEKISGRTWERYCLDAFGEYPTRRTIDGWISRYVAEKDGKTVSKKVTPIDGSDLVVDAKKVDGSYSVVLTLPEYGEATLQKTFHLGGDK